MKICVQNILSYCQVQRQADRGCILKSESNHLNIILMIISEYNWKTKTVGSNSNFAIYVRWLTTLYITKIIHVLIQ